MDPCGEYIDCLHTTAYVDNVNTHHSFSTSELYPKCSNHLKRKHRDGVISFKYQEESSHIQNAIILLYNQIEPVYLTEITHTSILMVGKVKQH
jgi:hypothetical protein